MKILVLLLLALTIALSSIAQTEIKKEYYKSGKIKSETPYVVCLGGVFTVSSHRNIALTVKPRRNDILKHNIAILKIC